MEVEAVQVTVATGIGNRRKILTKSLPIPLVRFWWELAQFEIYLRELGVPPISEAGYRRMSAVCSGKAREVVDLLTVSGQPPQMRPNWR